MSTAAQDYKHAIEMARQALTPTERAEWIQKAQAVYDQHKDELPAPQREKAEQVLAKLTGNIENAGKAKAQTGKHSAAIKSFRQEWRQAVASYDAAEDKSAAEAQLMAIVARAQEHKDEFTPEEWTKIERHQRKIEKKMRK